MCFQNIVSVRIVKRTGGTQNFKTINLRIGNADEEGSTSTEFSQNPVVGTFGNATTEMEHMFVLDPPVSGRYLTLQNFIPLVTSIDD